MDHWGPNFLPDYEFDLDFAALVLDPDSDKQAEAAELLKDAMAKAVEETGLDSGDDSGSDDESENEDSSIDTIDTALGSGVSVPKAKSDPHFGDNFSWGFQTHWQ